MREVYEAINEGAVAFLEAEYEICYRFVAFFAILILILISWGQTYGQGFLTMVSFVLGAATSTACGYIGMRVATFSNVRTTINAQKDGYRECFNTAFRAGAVMGFALTGLGILVLYVTLCGYSLLFDQDTWGVCMNVLSGYGLGGSSIAMFGRVGGGIYTKAADVGADLCGKVINDLPEDSPRNPATIADNVGDNVGDVAGMVRVDPTFLPHSPPPFSHHSPLPCSPAPPGRRSLWLLRRVHLCRPHHCRADA